jgi:competence protein ComEC
MSGEKGEKVFMFHGWKIVHLKGKAALAEAGRHCSGADLIVLAGQAPDGTNPEGCRMIDRRHLAKTGPLAVWPGDGGTLRLVPAHRSRRLWTGRRPAADDQVLTKVQ